MSELRLHLEMLKAHRAMTLEHAQKLEALGILDWACDYLGIDVPWRGRLELGLPAENPFEVPA